MMALPGFMCATAALVRLNMAWLLSLKVSSHYSFEMSSLCSKLAW
jgi:hypothetical protein